MHDVTEGGILGAVWEMCRIAGVGAELWDEAIPVEAVTKKICAHYDIDYLRLISSGSMIIMASPDKKSAILEKLEAEGVAAREIGRILPIEEGLYLLKDGEKQEIEPPRADELYKVVK